MDYTTIPLTRGQQTIVDPQDADLAQHRWTATSHNYAARYCGKRAVLMHRTILERELGRPLMIGEEVDHIDGNPLNNQRDNLRLATHAQNMRNRRRHVNNRSGCAGVYFNTRLQRWRAAIRVDCKERHLGYFHTLDAAVAARQQAEIEYYGVWARQA